MKRFETNEDIYVFARSLAYQARQAGDERTASVLEDALQAGFTASELLGELRLAFTFARGHIDDRYASDTVEQLDEAIRGIELAFKKANRGF